MRAAEDDGTSAKTATRSTERSVTTAPGKKNPPACWHMRGRLTNAATGQTIALVEGVELSRSLAFETAPGKRERRITQTNENVATGALHVGGSGKRSGGRSGGRGKVENPTPAAAASGNEEEEEELEVDRVLKKPGVWTAFGALASSKFFMYQVGRFLYEYLCFSCGVHTAVSTSYYLYFITPLYKYNHNNSSIIARTARNGTETRDGWFLQSIGLKFLIF